MTGPLPDPLQRLRGHLAPIVDLRHAAAVLAWDKQTHMPLGGGRARADQLSTLQRLAHELFISTETQRLLDEAERAAAGVDPDSDEAAMVRMARRDLDRATRLPADFVAEVSRAAAISNEVWRRARPANDFAAFAPHLAHMVDLTRRRADYLGYEDEPYDALLDLNEPGTTTREVAALFETLRAAQVPLLRAIVERGRPVETRFLYEDYDEATQEAFAVPIARAMGYDFDHGRLDRSAHPFTISFGPEDVRITTRYQRRYLPEGMFAIFHEAGHGIHGQGIPSALERTVLGRSPSGGVSESQSRLWENQVARSRSFWTCHFPRLRDHFPRQLGGVDAEGFYRAANEARPSLIRTDADEVTYNLHIILRFELELDLLAGRLAVADLPGAWREKMETYLGVVPETDADGVMQDTHWSSGGFATFPGYTLGNLIAAQLMEAAQRAHPDLFEQIGRGEFGTLLAWLREHVHRHGRKFLPMDLVRRATGRPLSSESYLRYLREKFGEIYEVTVA